MLVEKWGNDLAIRLPRQTVEALGLNPGDQVDLVITTTTRAEVDRDTVLADAVRRMRALRSPLPEGFRFDRDEIAERGGAGS